MDWQNVIKIAENTITGVGLQVLGAIVLYIIGRWLISFAVGLVQKGLSRQKIEPTLLRFIGNTISVVLNITLVIGILANFGVQTTSFAALLAGAGLAIGSAWGGLLANLRREYSLLCCVHSRSAISFPLAVLRAQWKR